MSALFALLPYILLLITISMVTIGVLRGRKRGFDRSVSKLITTAIAILITVIILVVFNIVMGGVISSVIDGVIDNTTNSLESKTGSFDKIFLNILENETILDVLRKFPLALVAPFIFVSIFTFVRPLTSLLNKVFEKVFKDKPKMSEKTSKVTGSVISGVNMLIITMVFLMPLVGILNFVGTTYNGIPEKTTESVSYLSVVDGLAKSTKNPAFKVVSFLGPNFTFNQVSAVKVDGKRVYPYKEIGYVANAAISLMPLIEDDMGDYTELHAKGIERFSKSVTKSEVFVKVFPSLLAEFSDSIINLDSKKGNEAKNEFLKSVSSFLGKNDEKTIKQDIKAAADIFNVLINHNFFKAYKDATNSGDSNAIIEVIAVERSDEESEKSMLGELLYVLSQNSGTVSIIPDAANLGLWYFCEIMQIPEDYIKSRETLITSITNLTSSTENAESIAKKIKAEFNKHGLYIDNYTTFELAQAIKLTTNLNSDKKVTEFLKVATHKRYNDRVNEENITGYEFASNFNNLIISLFEQYKETDIIVLENSKEDELTLAKIRKSFDSIEALAYGKTYETVSKTYTYHELKIDKETLSDVSETDMILEGNLIAGVVFNAMKFKNSVPKDNKDVVTVAQKSDFESLGKLFDELEESLLFGSASRKLLVASLRSSLLQGLDILTDLMVETIEEKEDFSAIKLFTSMKETIILVNSLGKDNASDDEVKASMKNLIVNMDQTTAGIITQMINKDTLKSYGVSDESAAPMANLMKNIMTDFGNAEGLSDEQYQKEVKAIQYLYKAAETKKGEAPQPMFGENGKYKSSDDFVETIMNSNVMLNSANSTSYGPDGKPVEDPLKVKNKMSENDKESLTNSISKYYNENKTNDATHNNKLKKDLVAVGVLMNVDVSDSIN